MCIDFDQVCPQTILGVRCDPVSINFVVSMCTVLGAMMRCGLLSVLSQIYDPLVMLVLLFLAARHIVQRDN